MRSLSAQETALLTSLVPPHVVRAWQQAPEHPDTCAAVCTHLHTALAAIMPLVPAPVHHVHLLAPERGMIGGMWAHGTVLCADLSGFTALSARLAANKRHGSEEVSTLINRVFAAPVHEVTRHGGDVVQFGGDALTAWWDAATVGTEHGMLASTAALRMQDQMAQFRAVHTSQGRLPLQLRVAVDSGDLFVAEAGDAAHTQLVVTGHLLHDVVCAQAYAAPGQVIVGPAVWHALGDPHGALVTAQLRHLQQLGTLETLPSLPPWRTQLAALAADPSPATIDALVQRIQLMHGFVPQQLPPSTGTLHYWCAA